MCLLFWSYSDEAHPEQARSKTVSVYKQADYKSANLRPESSLLSQINMEFLFIILT